MAVGILLLTQCFALYAGGEYGVIDEMYVRPEYRGQDIERQLLDEAVAVAQRRRWLRLDITGREGAPVRTGPPLLPGAWDSSWPMKRGVSPSGRDGYAQDEELLTELGGEGQEFAGDRPAAPPSRFGGQLRFRTIYGSPGQGPERGTPIGVLTLSTSFALYAGGELRLLA